MTIRYGMTNEAYRDSEGLSHSEAKLLRLKTPHHLHMIRTNRGAVPPRKPTPQMMLGTAVHCAVLEPSTFDQRYVADLDISRNSNAYRAFAQACIDQGLIPLSEEDRERVFAMRESLMADPQIAEALDGPGASEVSAWWFDPETGIICKCRPDRVREAGAGSLLIDLKTTADASQEAFSKSIANFGYHTQCDWYVDGYARASNKPVHGMLFVVIESEFPYACAAYTLDDLALEQARRDNARVRRIFKSCTDSGVWPGYGGAVKEIGLPRWALTHDEEFA